MRTYWVDIPPTAISAYTVDILEIAPYLKNPIRIISLNLHQISDFGDAQDEVLSVKWVRGMTTSGSGGTSVTPSKMNTNDTSSFSSCEVFNSTQASSGTPVVLARHGFNVRAGLERIYAPEEQMIVSYSDILCLRFEASPADAITLGGSVCFEEMG